MMSKESICRNCFHSYVCEQFNENKDDNNTKCHFANDHYIPRADVVPKSEVESIFNELMKEAREIADRYEKSANETSDYGFARIEYRGTQLGALLVLFKIAELKKKYTEQKND